MRPPRAPLVAALLCLALAPALHAEGPAWVGAPEPGEPTARARERLARYSLENTRALRHEGRLEMAEAAARRGLTARPDDSRLHRELALVLDALGRPEAADQERAVADALDPAPPAPPDAPLALPSQGVLVVLLEPDPEARPERRPRDWPDGPIAELLEQRLHTRLPDATVLHAAFDSVDSARTWLPGYHPRAVVSLRVDRVFCGESIKDGRFGMAWLRAAAARPGAPDAGPAWGRALVHDPRLAGGCEAEVVARALEAVLGLSTLRQALAGPAPADPPAWTTAAIRGLFPDLGERIEGELSAGHDLLAQGRLEDAAQAFERAARIDPEDPIVRSYLHEAEATLALSRELSQQLADDEPGLLPPRLSDDQRAALEAQLREEELRRRDLLAALTVLQTDMRLPDAAVLAALRRVEIDDPEAFGPTLARRRAGGDVEARAAFAPDGTELARYYFPFGDALPVLREENTRGDARPDRWIAYAGDARSEIWEDGRDFGRPDLRLVFRPGESRLLRVELDRDADGRPERVLHYAAGTLTAEARDTDGDGQLDTFDRLAEDGTLQLRAEDLDGDGGIDVRSLYRAGKLVRRQLASDTLADDT